MVRVPRRGEVFAFAARVDGVVIFRAFRSFEGLDFPIWSISAVTKVSDLLEAVIHNQRSAKLATLDDKKKVLTISNIESEKDETHGCFL